MKVHCKEQNTYHMIYKILRESKLKRFLEKEEVNLSQEDIDYLKKSIKTKGVFFVVVAKDKEPELLVEIKPYGEQKKTFLDKIKTPKYEISFVKQYSEIENDKEREKVYHYIKSILEETVGECYEIVVKEKFSETSVKTFEKIGFKLDKNDQNILKDLYEDTSYLFACI